MGQQDRDVVVLFDQANRLTCDQQFQLAKMIAGNVGYKLVPESSPGGELTIEERVERLEIAMRETNPGLAI